MKDLNVGNDGKFGISMLDIPKLLICGMENPSKFSSPVKGDWRASLGLSSDDELEPPEDEEGEEDEEEDDKDDDDDDDDEEEEEEEGEGEGDDCAESFFVSGIWSLLALLVLFK